MLSTPSLAAEVPLYDWSGAYIGGHLGYGDVENDGFFATSVDLAFGGGGLIGGGQVGWNWQHGNWVVGPEADVSFFNWMHADTRDEFYIAEADYLTTLRARVGWADDNVLFYATGGLAYLHASVLTSVGGSDPDQLTNDDRKDVSAFGGVAGVGIEWGVTRNLSIKAEGLYLLFNGYDSLAGLQEGCTPGDEGCLPPPAPENFFSIGDGFVFRLGANYRFAAPGADTSGEDYWRGAQFGAFFDWSGVYVGGHIGWGGLATDGIFNSGELADPSNPLLEPHLVTSLTGVSQLGLLGGAQIGVNYQLGQVVFGVEGDVSAVNWSGSESKFNDPSAITRFDSDYMATLRGRIGWADDNALFYMTGGLAFVDAELDNTAEGGGTKSVDALGGTVGAGAEWGITSNLSVKVEGLYLFFNRQTDIADLGPDGDAGDFFRMDDGFVVRVGANWRFLPFAGSAGGADHGGGIFGATIMDDGEDEDEDENEEEKQWTLSGVVNHALLLSSDGDKLAVNPVDNPQDSTGITLEGRFDLAHDSEAGVTLSLDVTHASADSIDQIDWNGDGIVVELPYAFAEFDHERWGTIAIGQTNSASDEIDNINLSGSDAITDASLNNWNGNFFLRATGVAEYAGLATGTAGAYNYDETDLDSNEAVRWGDFIDGKFAGESGRFVSYTTPELMGFAVSAALGQPQEIFLVKDGAFEFNQKTHGIFTDAAVRYAGEFSDFRVEGGIGAWRDTTREAGAEEPTDDRGLGGSLAVRHTPTGLNVAVNAGIESHTSNCAEPGDVTGLCRGPDRFVYVKGGIVRNDLVGWGPTALYGEFYSGRKAQHTSADGILRTFDVEDGDAAELAGSTGTAWGVGVVQQLSSAVTHGPVTDLYVGYRHYTLGVDLLDGSGAAVPARSIEDLDMLLAGFTGRF